MRLLWTTSVAAGAPRTSPCPSRLPARQSTTPHLASSGFNLTRCSPGEGKPVTGEVGPSVPTPGKRGGVCVVAGRRVRDYLVLECARAERRSRPCQPPICHRRLPPDDDDHRDERHQHRGCVSYAPRSLLTCRFETLYRISKVIDTGPILARLGRADRGERDLRPKKLTPIRPKLLDVKVSSF